MPIHVIIADSIDLFRTGIAHTLVSKNSPRKNEREGQIRIIAQLKSANQVLSTLRQQRFWPVILIIPADFTPLLPDIRNIADKRDSPVLVFMEREHVASDFVQRGAQGAIYRCAPECILKSAVHQLAQGKTFLQDLGMPGEIVDEEFTNRVKVRLSERQLNIISHVVQGYKNREIAHALYTSEQVIKNALRVIFDTLGVSDRLELTLYAIHHQILPAKYSINNPARRRFPRVQELDRLNGRR